MGIHYSFIIPVKKINTYIKEAVPEILKIKRTDYEILIFPDTADKTVGWEKADHKRRCSFIHIGSLQISPKSQIYYTQGSLYPKH